VTGPSRGGKEGSQIASVAGLQGWHPSCTAEVMPAEAPIKIVIQSDVSGPRDLLSHFILRQIDGMRARTGVHQVCRVEVEATEGFLGPTYLINLELGLPPSAALIQEVNCDPFLAVRDAFAIASERGLLRPLSG
jgi:hypothetical protein